MRSDTRGECTTHTPSVEHNARCRAWTHRGGGCVYVKRAYLREDEGEWTSEWELIVPPIKAKEEGRRLKVREDEQRTNEQERETQLQAQPTLKELPIQTLSDHTRRHRRRVYATHADAGRTW